MQELLRAASGGTGVAQVLARVLLAAGGDLSGVSSDGRPIALMPDIKVLLLLPLLSHLLWCAHTPSLPTVHAHGCLAAGYNCCPQLVVPFPLWCFCFLFC